MKTVKADSTNKLTDIFMLFLAGTVIGWSYEVLLHLFKSGTFVNRGVLHGPWLPIYGFGCLLMIWLKYKVGNKPILYFALCVTASGALEYFTSWIMECIYPKRWWDYSGCPLNLNGRIFAGGLIIFGLAVCLFAYFLYPVIEKKYRDIPCRAKNIMAAVMYSVFMINVFISVLVPNTGTGITY